jgi:Ca2+-binding EF-hand superfamily protein
MEFRDILFPIITGRYMEEHIRKLFSLFDINKNGCLGFKEITGKIDWIYFLFQEN